MEKTSERVEDVLPCSCSLCYTYRSLIRRNYIEMFNTKLLTYDITIPNYVRDKTRKIKHKNKVVLGVIITNIISGIRTGTKIVYSRNKAIKTESTERDITVPQIISCVKVLERDGFIINTIGTIHNRCSLCVLLDSGSSCCLIKQWCLPPGVLQKDLSESKTVKTLFGKTLSQYVVTLHNRRPRF